VLERTVFFAADPGYQVGGLREALRASGSDLVVADCEASLLSLVDQFSPRCAVVFHQPCLERAVDLAHQVRLIDCSCPLVVLTSVISAEAAVAAMRAGISDLIDETASGEILISRLRSACERYERVRPRNTGQGTIQDERIVGSSAAMTRIREQIGRVAASEANVLITGESGTGKELVAEMIHRNSKRSGGPFVAVNCAAVPDTLLESELFGHERGAFTGANIAREGKLQFAKGGTLFLDEIGDMSPIAQAKILRAIESRVIQRLGSNTDTPVKVRLVAATNQDLELLIQEKKFRQDLYFRLNVVRLKLPPLREHPEDIPELTEHIVRDLSQRPLRQVQGDVIRRFRDYDWPGNIRQLRNVLESILVFSSSRSIGLADVPPEIRETLRSSSACYEDERSRIISALNSTGWNRNKAAEILCCSRMTLYRKMVKYSITSEKSDCPGTFYHVTFT